MSSPGTGVQHLREPDEHVLDADHVDAVAVAARRLPRPRLLDRHLLLGDLADLELLEDLVDDLRRGQLPRAERDVEVLGLLEAGLADHSGEDGRAGELLVREVLALERVLEQLATLRLEILLLLAREELADLVPGARRSDEREPVAGGAAGSGLAREDLDPVAAAEAVVERNDPAVHLRADRAVTDVGVHRVGEVDRRRAGRQRLHLVLRREDEHLLVEEIGAEALHELARVGLVGVDVHELPHPGVPLLGARSSSGVRPGRRPSARRLRARPSRASRASAPGSRADAPPDRSRSYGGSGSR